jgi:hypothetical protein
MSDGAMTGLIDRRAKGTAMEGHAGTIGIRRRHGVRRRRRRLVHLQQALRQRRRERARRAHALRVSSAHAPYVPGSEHTHMLPRQRGF